MWHTIYNWPWATIWAAVSGIFTAGTVGVATWAMLRWQKQDELKVKLAFKQAIGEYAFQLVRMPEVLFTKDLEKYETDRRSLAVLYHSCVQAMAMTEHLLDKNEVVTTSWEKFEEAHVKYLSGRDRSTDIDRICSAILNEPFVFGK
ncbi:hypothetical protein [Enterobacter roggenkampii]|uniref:hypothetical protein n=1 Tax=Enterobacter roggenkampii TaxID=1812935 RepID=UPI000BA8AD09|nr:hypothetical protein [Enterobacter roggenkampii]PAO24631.1 hypothetical protein CIW56_01500 [Enterobacter roggenkampii]